MERHLAEIEELIRKKHVVKCLELTEQKQLTDTGTNRNPVYAHAVSKGSFIFGQKAKETMSHDFQIGSKKTLLSRSLSQSMSAPQS